MGNVKETQEPFGGGGRSRFPVSTETHYRCSDHGRERGNSGTLLHTPQRARVTLHLGVVFWTLTRQLLSVFPTISDLKEGLRELCTGHK